MPVLLTDVDVVDLPPMCGEFQSFPGTKQGPHPEPTPQAAPVPQRPTRILVVDDERRIRLALRVVLESEGYEISEASDGEEALQKIVSVAPDLMILDLAMPKMDGMRTIAELQALHGQLKPRIIMLTAWGSPPVVMQSIGMGVSIFLEKPLSPQALRDAVRRALAEGTDEGAGIPVDWTPDLKRKE